MEVGGVSGTLLEVALSGDQSIDLGVWFPK